MAVIFLPSVTKHGQILLLASWQNPICHLASCYYGYVTLQYSGQSIKSAHGLIYGGFPAL